MGRHNKLQDDGGDAAPEAVPSPEPNPVPSPDVTLPDAGPAIAAARAAAAGSAPPAVAPVAPMAAPVMHAAPVMPAPQTADPAPASGVATENGAAAEKAEKGAAAWKLLGLAPWKRRVVFVAPLPVLLLTIVVGIVAYSASTGQISLNFAGGAHEPTEPKDNQVSQRGPGAEARASRNASRNHHLYVAFRAAKTPTGFRGTATIVNRGTNAVPAWTFAFSIPGVQVVSATAPGGVMKQYRPYFWMRSAPGAAPIAPGQSVKISYVARGPVHGPTFCKLNYRTCDRF